MPEVNESISENAALTIAKSLLDRKPSDVMVFQNHYHCLEAIAEQMSSLNPTLTKDEHLQSIYDYILSCSLFKNHNSEETISPAATSDTPAELLPLKSRECLTEAFLEYFDRQIMSRLGLSPEPYVAWIQDKLLLRAHKHITTHNCEKCREELSQRQGPQLWAQIFYGKPIMDHDYSGEDFVVH